MTQANAEAKLQQLSQDVKQTFDSLNTWLEDYAQNPTPEKAAHLEELYKHLAPFMDQLRSITSPQKV